MSTIGKLENSTTQEETPELIATKLEANNYRTSGTSPYITSMGAIHLRGWSGRMREISLFVTFFVVFYTFILFVTSTRVLPKFVLRPTTIGLFEPW